jgi:hypothetical protein
MYHKMVHCASGSIDKLVSLLRNISVIKKNEIFFVCGEA